MRGEDVKTTLYFAKPASVPCSILTHFWELHKVEVIEKSVVRYVPLDDAETPLLKELCEHCKVRPECTNFGYSRGPPTMSERKVEQNGSVYQLDFLEMLH